MSSQASGIPASLGSSTASRLGQSLLPIVLALLFGALLLVLLERDPLTFYADIVTRGLLSPLGLQDSLTRSAPLLLLAEGCMDAGRQGMRHRMTDHCKQVRHCRLPESGQDARSQPAASSAK